MDFTVLVADSNIDHVAANPRKYDATNVDGERQRPRRLFRTRN